MYFINVPRLHPEFLSAPPSLRNGVPLHPWIRIRKTRLFARQFASRCRRLLRMEGGSLASVLDHLASGPTRA